MGSLPFAMCALFTCLITGMLAQPTLAAAQTRNVDTAEVRTTATARRTVRPDQAAFTIQFTVDGPTPSRAGELLAARADTVRRALLGLGIPRDSMVTGSTWYWWPERIHIITGQRRIRGPGGGYQVALDTIPLDNGYATRAIIDTTYRARETIQVRVSDIAKVGPAIDVALAMRITEISGVTFSATDIQQAQLAALQEATSRAHEQAEAIASASGGRLGRVLSLSTQPDISYPERYDFQLMSSSAGQSATSGTEVTAPAVVVTVTIYGRWQLLGR